MRPGQDIDELSREALGGGIPPEAARRLLRHLAAFESAVRIRAATEQSGARRLGLRVAAVAAALLLLGVLAPLLSRPTPTWASVVERFDAAPFVNAVVYMRSSPLNDPVQIEVWLGREGRWRMHAGGSVLFGNGAVVTHEVRLRHNDQPDSERALALVRDSFERVRDAGEISLDTIIHSLPIGGLTPAPVTDQQAPAANELAVFDLLDPSGAERVRVWALRDSRLPVRIRYADAEGGEVVDVLLSYASEPEASFFDPAEFRRLLGALGPERALAQPAALTDTGGALPPP